MKYKLININTKEEHLCDKVTIDGFDYYVSDQSVNDNDWAIYNNLLVKVESIKFSGAIIVLNVGNGSVYGHSFKNAKKVIATTNPNIDIPKVVDKAELLAKNIYRNNPTDRKDAIYRYNTDINAPRKRKAFVKGYNKHAETHPFSEEDADAYADAVMSGCLLRAKEWKEQQPKIVYYENL